MRNMILTRRLDAGIEYLYIQWRQVDISTVTV